MIKVKVAIEEKNKSGYNKDKEVDMYQREWLILKELEKGGYVTSAQLAQKIGVSVKTVQKSIAHLNESMTKQMIGSIVSKTGQGYRLQIRQQDHYQKLVAELDGRQGISGAEQRQIYLLNELLKQPYVKSEQVEVALYISKKTLSNTVRALRELLERYQIDIKTRPHYGMYLDGQEKDIRLMMVLVEGVELYDLSKEEKIAIEQLLLIQGVQTDFYRANVLSILRATLTRVQRGYGLPEVAVSSKTGLADLSEKYGWGLQTADIVSIEETINSFRVKVSSLASNQQLKLCLSMVEEAFGLDFSRDKDFINSLWSHVQKLHERVKNRVILKNPLLAEIKQNLKNEFVMASLLSGALAREWSAPILEDEIGFLSLIFATCTSQIKDLKKHMLVVCFDSESGKDFLQSTYQRLFGRYIHQVTVCNPEEIAQQDLSAYDCIVSTVELPVLTPYNPHYVSYFLEERDKEAIKQQLTTTENLFVNQLLEEVIFLDQLPFESKEQLVEDICRHIEQVRGIDVTEKVLKRLSMGVTQLGHKIVLLHPQGKVDEHFVSVTVLVRPVYWESSEVRVVVLASLPTIDSVSRLIYQILSTFMIEDIYMEGLLQAPTADNLQVILQKIKEKELKGYVY